MQWVKEHYLGLIFAFCIGFITVAPHLAFIHNLGAEYKGLYPMKADAEPYYLSRIHEIYKGHLSTNTLIFEEKYTIPRATFNLIDPIMALPGLVFGLSVPTLALIYKFLFPAIIGFLIYLLGLKLFKNKWWSAVTAVAVMCGYYLLYRTDLMSVLKFDMVFNSFSDYSRPTYPQFSSIVFFAYLIVLYKALQEKIWKWFIWLGVIFGAMFYVYYFEYTFVLALNAVAIFVFFMLKQKDVSKKLLSTTLMGIVLGSYSIWNLLHVVKHPSYALFSSMQRMFLSHAPIFSLIGVGTFVLFAGYYIWKKKYSGKGNELSDYFVLCLLLATFVASNQQVLTGRVIQEGHYYWFFGIPIYVIALCYLVFKVLGDKKKIIIGLGSLIVLGSFWTTGFVQYSSYKFWFEQIRSEQRYVSVFDYLNLISKPDDVVFANSEISQLVPVYTFNSVVWEDGAYSYLIPLNRNKWDADFILKNGFENNIHTYRADYVLWDYKVDPDWKMDKKGFLQYLDEVGEVKIYKILK